MAHTGDELCKKISQNPVRKSVGSWCLMDVDLAQLAFDFSLVDDELSWDVVQRWRRDVNVQRSEISGDVLEEDVHASS